MDCGIALWHYDVEHVMTDSVTPGRNSSIQNYKKKLCNFIYHTLYVCRYKTKGAPQCPEEVQDELQTRLRRAAQDGHVWAKDMLTVRPCELFSYLEGRTLWIIGDSMSKVSLRCSFSLAYSQLKLGDKIPPATSVSIATVIFSDCEFFLSTLKWNLTMRYLCWVCQGSNIVLWLVFEAARSV